MLSKRSRNNKGFAYIVAVAILGLLAFMGLFLMQSSSVEYSQTSMSVYRTMGHQLAEAAAEECCVYLEEDFKKKTEGQYFEKLIQEAATSGPLRTGGQTGKNPIPTNDFDDLKDKIKETNNLISYFVSRAGFSIDKVLPTIKDLRPIPNGPMDYQSCYFRPTDRANPFDTELSNNWYCTLQIDVTVSVQKSRKIQINYQLSKDIKILNLSPIGRNYSLFSIIGHDIKSNDPAGTMGLLKQEMNGTDEPAGRLILFNQPFQSRVYMHGPAIIFLENANLANDIPHRGAYNTLGEEYTVGPGPNQAFQYSDTFYGFSYFPSASRAIFPSKNFSGMISTWVSSTGTKNDLTYMNAIIGSSISHDTVCGGILPDKNKNFLSRLGNLFTEGFETEYTVGSYMNQKFLPAGPYCRTPWRYVPSKPPREKGPFAPNQKDAPPMEFPETEDTLRIEHRWNPDNSDVADNTKIYSRAYKVKYKYLTGNVNGGDVPEEVLSEFGLNYYNNPDPEGFLAKFGSSIASFFKGVWNVVTLPAQGIVSLVGPLVGKLFNKGDGFVDGDEETQCANLFPTNYRYNYHGIITRHLKDETEIPRDNQDRWILSGVYWLDTLTIEQPITYIGTGTLLVSRYTPDQPLTIKGDVLAYRAPGSNVPQGHMNIFYHPYTASPRSTDVSDRMLTIEGPGTTVEASVYSCYGVRSIGGSVVDFVEEFGADPKQPNLLSPNASADEKANNKWDKALDNAMSKSNSIFGNYVNSYMNLHKQKDDLWVIHNIQNPLYFQQHGDNPDNYIATQELIDSDEGKRKEFEYAVHEIYVSPKIQHIGIRGAL